MKTQVYALAFCESRILIAMKNSKGYFFHNKSGGGTIYPNGIVLNGKDNFALPGGKLDEYEKPEPGAVREFLEETGVDLNKKYAKVTAIKFEDNSNCYYGVYFDLGDKIENVLSQAEENLIAGAKASKEVQEKKYSQFQYDQLLTDFPNCPIDNELAAIQILDINNDETWKLITKWKNDYVIGWYYNIIEYFKNHIAK